LEHVFEVGADGARLPAEDDAQRAREPAFAILAQEFARLRREQVIAESRLTPSERLERANELVRFAIDVRRGCEPVSAPGRPPRNRSKT